jgi:hypothetical protein
MDEIMRRARWVVKSKYLLYFLFANLPSWASVPVTHDIHVSLCELRWNEDSDAFEVSLKVFIDDLELALGKQGLSGLYIGTPKEAKEANSRIADYISKHFSINIDGVKLTPEFVGKELSEDYLAVWCYFQFSTDLQHARKCVISNDVLLELYDDQRNIMDIRMDEAHKAYTIFQPGNHSWSYTF